MSVATPNKYANGRIYRIVCGDLTYIGSTCQELSQRMADHRKGYTKWKNNPTKYDNISSSRLFEAGKPEIFLIEDCPCTRKEQLLARERHYIETVDCVNKTIPGRTQTEYRQDNVVLILERHREYNEANIEKIREYQREYARAHRKSAKSV